MVFAVAAGGVLLFPGAKAARADAILDWNVIALSTTASGPFNPPLEARNLAIVHAAMFDAVNSITGEFHPYAVKLASPNWASAEAAAMSAAHFTLVRLYPAQQEMVDAAYVTALASLAGGPARDAGIATGETVAAQILALRASDGAQQAVTAPYTPGAAPGDWIPTPPAMANALDPGWGAVRPFLLTAGSQFRPGPPPALQSGQYARDFDEIRQVGAAEAPARTPEQTDLARFWVATAPQNWNPAARQVSAAHGLSLSQNARAFALLNLAGADAFIAAWDAKFTYNQWRPVTAIREAGTDGNPQTIEDPAWTPLLITPPFPDYIAGHTVYAGTAEAVLEHVFGRHPGVVMSLTSASAPGVVETYSTFEEIADGVVDARVWGGIHWRTSSLRGKRAGEGIGTFAARNFLRPVRP
jgi:hypothetical protein